MSDLIGAKLTNIFPPPTYPKVRTEIQPKDGFEEIIFSTTIIRNNEQVLIRDAFRFVNEVDQNPTIGLANTLNRFHEKVYNEINYPITEDEDSKY